MKEDFLHYVWQFKKFDFTDLKTAGGESVSIINSGYSINQPGPDFFNAQLVIGNQKWAGNVEIHIKSSDWYIHNHEKDTAYNTVILHVVWEHDIDVFRADNTIVPVLELKPYVLSGALEKYQSLTELKTWINCEKQLYEINDFIRENWQERLFLERLNRKSAQMLQTASETANDWEAVLFCFLAKNFGLNVNGTAFFEIACSIPFAIIRKESFEAENLESLLLGKAGLLNGDKEDVYFNNLKSRYNYLSHKHRLDNSYIQPLQFFRLRPDNFPTIRLSQLAQLYYNRQNIFSEIMNARSLKELYAIFDVSASDYWQTHYQFDKESPKKKKLLSRSFIDLLIINTIVPLKFAYQKSRGETDIENLIQLLRQVAPEKNTVIDKFSFFKMKSQSAYDSQSLLELKNEYCNHNKCLKCAFGLELLKQ